MNMKNDNPSLPILLRECEGTIPRMTVKYNFNKENSIICDGLSDVQIRNKLQELSQ